MTLQIRPGHSVMQISGADKSSVQLIFPLASSARSSINQAVHQRVINGHR